MKPTVSIIITSFKYGKFLKDCINSVRRQTYPNIEIIVVADGSTDETVDVCKEMHVRCIWQENAGAGAARNNGIRNCTGEYVMCLDADDMLTPNSIEEHMKMANETTVAQCAMAEFYGGTQIHYPRGATIESLLVSNSVYCNAVFPKKAWEEVGGYDESKTMRLGYEDYELWIRMADNGYKFVNSFVIGLLYRFHGSSMTRTTTHKYHKELMEYITTKHKALYPKYNVKRPISDQQ